ncbi:Clp protease N-terminal domain-containing protein [Brevibacterium sp. FME17]|uniref:Clp protease N-terminal domain-containing protein n=1 Tax=Brevibacterium sp. FME17 TaxID=2742606 RepID=UPI001866AD97|nr:Clp protease N-terminal domain-containing protein [Brevibacterium sp. FME17]
MSARTMPIFLMAGWREAVRAREPYIDLDHLLIGLIAAGGPAAQTLAQYGLTLNSARTAASAVHAEALAFLGVDVHALASSPPLTIDELNRDDARMPMAERADRLVDSLGSRATERDLLKALLAERSGTIRGLIERSDADLEAISKEVGDHGGWTTPIPRRNRVVEAQAETRTAAVELTHFIPADPQLVRSVAADPTCAPHCLMFPDTMRPDAGRTLTMTVSKRGRTSTLSLVLAEDEEGHVRWDDRWDDQPFGWYDLRFAPVSGGTQLTLARAVRPIGIFDAVLTPLIRLNNGLGLLLRAQNLSLACAEVDDQKPHSDLPPW